jgi:hypothetical protein
VRGVVRNASSGGAEGALYCGRRIDDGPNAITQGAGSVGDGERLTAQMARHCGHHRKRLPPCIFFRTSTGERRHSGHGSSTSSGLSMRGVPWLEKGATCPAGGAWTEQVARHTLRWLERDAPASIGRPAPVGRTEHQQCQGGRVQTLAGTRTVEDERSRKAELSLVRTAIPREPAGRSMVTAPRGGLRVGHVLFAVAQVATKAVVVGPQPLAVRGMGPIRPTALPAHRGAFLHRGSATAATSPHASPRHTRSRVRVPQGMM